MMPERSPQLVWHRSSTTSLYLSPSLTPTIESAKRIVKLIPGRRLQGDCNDREPDQQVAELIFLHDILIG